MKTKLKLTIVIVTLFSLINSINAQTNTTKVNSNIPIEMLFPQGKTKALILSYDDGRTEDRLLVKLLNKYGLIGTFHLNSNKLGTTDYLSKLEIKKLFTKHEVSVHTANHPNLTNLTKIEVENEVIEDRKELEKLMGYPVRGMAYPFGNNNDFVVEVVKDLGIEYARTVDDTYAYKIPENFLKWHPTVHQFAKAFWEPNNSENDQKEIAVFYQLINDFMNTKELALLEIWGHSWEMENNQVKWKETEKFFKLLANNPAIYYTTQIDLVDYINAFRNIEFSVQKNIVYNKSAITVCLKKNDKVFHIPSGKTIYLTNELSK